MTISDIVELVILVVTIASLVTGWTKTTKDDDVIDKIRTFIGRLGIAKFHDAPGSLKFPGQDPR